ncbi:hypothetical protein BaRGS_00018875 [Batillaria attramentaria]|uniref:Uncharacterized protein n=1 Tax=Batillaria attramentaria TaxID=370345 RepID=A0ABD0KSB7_9CAEN
MEEDALEQQALEEILKDIKRGAERAREHGALGWQKNPAPAPNKNFLRNMLVSTLRDDNRGRRNFRPRDNHKFHRSGDSRGLKRRFSSDGPSSRNSSKHFDVENRISDHASSKPREGERKTENESRADSGKHKARKVEDGKDVERDGGKKAKRTAQGENEEKKHKKAKKSKKHKSKKSSHKKRDKK